MPARKKKKKKKSESLWDFELSFSDTTMAESGGSFSSVKKLMEETPPIRILTSKGSSASFNVNSLPTTGQKWVIRSTLYITSELGEGAMVLNFYHDRNVFITEYSGNQNSVYNPDIRCLCQWCQSSGWKIPQPIERLIKEDIHFWKQMWETTLVDSEYLDNKYGIRSAIAMRDSTTEADKYD